MAASLTRPDPSSPASVAEAGFSTARRGFQQDEVRAFLVAVAAELGRLRERERVLEGELADARDAAHEHPRLDEATITEMLGEETVRVLQTARESASQIKIRAEEAAARIVREASDEANRMRQEAEVEAARKRQDAAADAEAEVALAKQQGREMVNEARAYRERVLADLDRRTKLARQQIEELVHGRDRLLQVFERARLVAVDVTSELKDIDGPAELVNLAPTTGPVPLMVPAARRPGVDETTRTDPGRSAVSAESAPEPTPDAVSRPDDATIDAFDTDADTDTDTDTDTDAESAVADVGDTDLRDEDAPDTDPGTDAANLATDPGADSPDTDTRDTSATDPGTEDADDGGRAATEHGAPDPDPAGRAVDEGDATAGSSDASDLQVTGDEIEAPGGGDDTGPRSGGDNVVALFRDRPAADGTGHGSHPRPDVGGIFARLRSEIPSDTDPADHTVESAVAEREPGLDADTTPEPDDGVPVVEVVEVVEVVDGGDGGDGVAAPTAFTRRDEVVVPLIVTAARKLKRVLADEQNGVLDTLRQRDPVTTLEQILPAADEHLARYIDAIRDDLLAAAAAGAAELGATDTRTLRRSLDKAGSLESTIALVRTSLIAPLRDRLERSVVDGDGDNEAITRRVRAVYREWKVQHIDEQLDDVFRFAHGGGLAVTAEPGSQLVWTIDESAPACPDCEDNSLAGPVVVGEPFPTGHVAAPAHPGCRCLTLPFGR